ncbi:uncharacterized protein BO95DRAFT_19260 [Aspergillus brunneoviolaceus CBS 621.78]|uniref:Uncharacterized protein n=1 Tax=Aspergillus brunneoviolaceus CBS 621.78 TaxID=1450534 RepID=A0ACD1FTM9_9EURO|nr:hypothetical protein BO95DRAFT_19260 [Aspergillus brunneoviolaceus CBS 621.78]RAH40355.1 hypothetical protein BO95DRAFT_19260 [Aspergillus brunneoviolaceus CBS 621.78]
MIFRRKTIRSQAPTPQVRGRSPTLIRLVKQMLSPSLRRGAPLPFGFVADVLFHIIISGEVTTILSLCRLNKATYETIKILEPHICTWFMRCHGIDTFDPILTMSPWTGEQTPLTIHTLVRFLHRHSITRDLSRHLVPAVWGPFCEEDNTEMNFEAELRLAQRLERGLHVLFQMADIARDTERLMPPKKPLAPVVSGRLFVLGKMLDEYDELPPQRRKMVTFEEYTNHVYTVLKWGYVEADVGRRRLEFRGWLDEQTEIDFHAALRMLRELMERMLLRHGPKDWHRDARNEYSVISWFILKQPPRSLAKLFLDPQNECCELDVKGADCGAARKCHYSDPLDNYWKAWKNVPDLGCQDCDCKRRVRSWSVKPALIDARGREFNRCAERYLREMWGQRHVGLHRAFTLGVFSAVIG